MPPKLFSYFLFLLSATVVTLVLFDAALSRARYGSIIGGLSVQDFLFVREHASTPKAADEEDRTTRARGGDDVVRSPSSSSSTSVSPPKDPRRHRLGGEGVLESPTGTTDAAAAKVVVVPLEAASGTHHVTLHVGHPVPQPQTLIVDTGSHLTAWLCAADGNNKNYVGQQLPQLGRPPPYDPSKSASGRAPECGQCQVASNDKCGGANNDSAAAAAAAALWKPRCNLSQRYTEGSSWTAYEVNERVALLHEDGGDGIDNTTASTSTTTGEIPATDNATASIDDFAFGCQTSVTGLFRKQVASGILGLEPTRHSIVHRLYEQNRIGRNAFSLCLAALGGPAARNSTVMKSQQQSRSGYMSLGGPLASRHLEPMQYTSLVNASSSDTTDQQLRKRTDTGQNSTEGHQTYRVTLRQLWLGGTCIICRTNAKLRASFNSGKGTVIDSGTTDTFLPAAIAKHFMYAWSYETNGKFAYYPNHRSGRYTFKEFEQLPTLHVVLEGNGRSDRSNVTISAPPLHYMEGAIPTGWVGKRELTNRLYVDETGGGAVLGLNVLLGYDTYFDVQGHRIGFAKADCG